MLLVVSYHLPEGTCPSVSLNTVRLRALGPSTQQAFLQFPEESELTVLPCPSHCSLLASCQTLTPPSSVLARAVLSWSGLLILRSQCRRGFPAQLP